ncbi:MAG: hypothetical protein ACOCYW_06755 [Roseicyclus sp.]
MKPFEFRRDFVEAEDGVATVDWVVLLAALVGLGYAIVDRTSAPLGQHTRDIRGEIQDTSFETSWFDDLSVGASGEGIPGVISASGTTAEDSSDGVTAGDDTTGAPSGGDTTGDDTSGDDTGSDDTGSDDTGGDDTDKDTAGGGGSDGGEEPIVPASNVQGCPDSGSYIATPVVKTGAELSLGQISDTGTIVGGASGNLVSCPDIDGLGNFFANPTYTLDLSEMDSFWRLAVVVQSRCNTALLVQDAKGTFIFDADSGSEDPDTGAGNDLDGLIRIFDMSSLNGRVNIWVGTDGGEICENADVTISLR